mmetsp:Transcript_11030/g.26969  ORF Transcript_11030/g.26969 Transcript_11030/m.26969 type:complete len:271 (-) Transcript_11030:256-1068(-)
MPLCRLHRPHDLLVRLQHAVRNGCGRVRHGGGGGGWIHGVVVAHVKNCLFRHARQLPLLHRAAVSSRPLLDGAPQREVGDELQVTQAPPRHRASLVALLQPALDARAVVRVARGHHHRVHHQLHGHRTLEVGGHSEPRRRLRLNGRGLVVRSACVAVAACFTAADHLRAVCTGCGTDLPSLIHSGITPLRFLCRGGGARARARPKAIVHFLFCAAAELLCALSRPAQKMVLIFCPQLSHLETVLQDKGFTGGLKLHVQSISERNCARENV